MFESNILKAWTASFVRRWHTHPQLSGTNDFNCGHQQRTALLLLLFWPDSSRDAIIDALVHDQGEDDSGDMAHPAKARFPEIRSMLQIVEESSVKQQGFRFEISEHEEDRRRWADLLDSYLWMLMYKPRMKDRPEWKAQASKLENQAVLFGLHDFPRFIGEATAYLTSEGLET